MAKLPRQGFERPTKDEKQEEALDSLFADDAAQGQGNGENGQEKAQKPQNDAKKGEQGREASPSNQKTRSAAPAQSKSSARGGEVQGNSESSLDINEIIGLELEADGEVTRNFRLKKSNMNRIKSLTTKANNHGRRCTQDDILNQILSDWFKSKGL